MATTAKHVSALPAVDALLLQRTSACEQLRRAVRGEGYLFGAVLLAPADLAAVVPPAELGARTRQWYTLALSLGRVIALNERADIVLRAACQLMAEYEHWRGDTYVPDALLALTGSGSGDYLPDSLVGFIKAAVSGGAEESVRTALHTAGGGIVYECLLTSSVTGPYAALDYVEVVSTLAGCIMQLYMRFYNEAGNVAKLANAADAVSKLDKRVTHYFIKPLAKQVCSAASSVLSQHVYGSSSAVDGGGSVSAATGGGSISAEDLEGLCGSGGGSEAAGGHERSSDSSVWPAGIAPEGLVSIFSDISTRLRRAAERCSVAVVAAAVEIGVGPAARPFHFLPPVATPAAAVAPAAAGSGGARANPLVAASGSSRQLGPPGSTRQQLAAAAAAEPAAPAAAPAGETPAAKPAAAPAKSAPTAAANAKAAAAALGAARAAQMTRLLPLPAPQAAPAIATAPPTDAEGGAAGAGGGASS